MLAAVVHRLHAACSLILPFVPDVIYVAWHCLKVSAELRKDKTRFVQLEDGNWALTDYHEKPEEVETPAAPAVQDKKLAQGSSSGKDLVGCKCGIWYVDPSSGIVSIWPDVAARHQVGWRQEILPRQDYAV
jgi:hypothetical protein